MEKKKTIWYEYKMKKKQILKIEVFWNTSFMNFKMQKDREGYQSLNPGPLVQILNHTTNETQGRLVYGWSKYSYLSHISIPAFPSIPFCLVRTKLRVGGNGLGG